MSVKFSNGAFEFENRGQVVRVPVEFSSRHKIGGRDDLLAKALGLKAITKKTGQPLSVLDLTAGLGRDAFHMAQLGCEVVALERNITLVKALQKAWSAAEREEKLSFVQAEALEYLKAVNTSNVPDVIYYDPMFPEKKKSALAGKESQLLQLLASPASESEEAEIARTALASGVKRLVVKRPLPAPAILPKPDVVFRGKAVRFDVYSYPRSTIAKELFTKG